MKAYSIKLRRLFVGIGLLLAFGVSAADLWLIRFR